LTPQSDKQHQQDERTSLSNQVQSGESPIPQVALSAVPPNAMRIVNSISRCDRALWFYQGTRGLAGFYQQAYEHYLTPTSQRRQPSAIRRLQPLVSLPGMISLGGGLPNPELFPISGISFTLKSPTPQSEGSSDEADTFITFSEAELNDALQYSPTSGIPKLHAQLMELQRREHGSPNLDSHSDMALAITVGSQDGFCKAIEMLIEPGSDDIIFLEAPTYSGALSFLQAYGARMAPVRIDEHGLIPSELETVLEKELGSGKSHRRRVLYTIPTAQNPSGATLAQSRRQEIYELAQRYDLIILEDDPYWFVHPNRNNFDSFLALDSDGRVVRFDSFSKVISSGLRIGFATGPAPLIEKLNFHIQATNLHNSGVSQVMLHKILDGWGEEGFNVHCERVAKFYCQRRDALVSAANKYLTGLAEWHVPDAGMFLWFRLLGIDNTKTLIEEKAAKSNILLVPGQAFSPLDEPSEFVRASFSTASDADMDLAMQRLARLILDNQ
jgi:kynurenine/2-aminoadipate aminotransferase